jgi:DNA polymerase-3 subunit epsilon
MAAQLAAHPDYRVLRRLDPRQQRPALTGPTVRRAAIVDTETTGTDATADKIIELAIVVFEYCHATGAVGRVLDSYDALEDPGMPIPPSSTAIHGITDEMVAGQRIDDGRVGHLLESVGIVIAHNAGFDRRFLEPRLPVFSNLPWGCSWLEVPWSEAGIASAKLEYLAYRYGFFYDGHRADVDCHALLEVLSQPFGTTGGNALKVLLDCARTPSYRLWANNSPFESKDVLKKRGYWWDAGRRCWSIEVRSQRAVQENLAWLNEAVYAGKSVEVELDEFDARNRYSTREGRRTRLRTK